MSLRNADWPPKPQKRWKDEGYHYDIMQSLANSNEHARRHMYEYWLVPEQLREDLENELLEDGWI